MIKKPVVPEHVCPYIDMVIELMEEMAEEEDLVWRRAKMTLATALLEHVRHSAELLRTSSKYWHDKSKRDIINKKKELV
jgi:hypothetical protein